jgi:hypothetical protein
MIYIYIYVHVVYCRVEKKHRKTTLFQSEGTIWGFRRFRPDAVPWKAPATAACTSACSFRQRVTSMLNVCP